jgi:phenylalanyl-tRNA synthetase beta chain
MALTEALGIEPDVVLDITVEGNRPDAWSMAGIARDLAARRRLPFTLPEPLLVPSGPPTGTLASAAVEVPQMCPRLTVSVLEHVEVTASPQWLVRRLVMAGMRPINNVVDASNYVMLELGQPTHPYDLDALAAPGLLVRRAEPGEVLVTLDGSERTLGQPGRGLGETGDDCVICDAAGRVVGLAGIMGGTSSEIGEGTSRVLLEAAYFEPMVIARTSKRLALRTEASVRFERGCDPFGIDRAVARFCELLAQTSPNVAVAPGMLDVRGQLTEHRSIPLHPEAVNRLLGTDLSAERIAELLGPLGFGSQPLDGALEVAIPSNRPDVRPAPAGVADVTEEVARTLGYRSLARRQPSWPSPGGLTVHQRERRRVRQAMVGLGAAEAWTASLVPEDDHRRVGQDGQAVRIANPMAADQGWLRRSQLPGLLRALVWNLDRRQSGVRLFEVGTVFSPPSLGRSVAERAGAGGAQLAELPEEREMLSALFAADGDDATTAVAAWEALCQELRLVGVRIRNVAAAPVPGLHPTRSARLLTVSGAVLGSIGEVDPAVSADFGATDRRIGWLEVDLSTLSDHALVPRRPEEAVPVSRYPSAEVDLAFVVRDDVPADEAADALRRGGGDLVESVELFDVFRGPAVPPGHRSLAYRVRFCALDRTLSDEEVATLRQRCVDETVSSVGAALR